ncbi:MAG: hypothetical protein ABW328_11540 [Ilumatobacteraceae bacterium]
MSARPNKPVTGNPVNDASSIITIYEKEGKLDDRDIRVLVEATRQLISAHTAMTRAMTQQGGRGLGEEDGPAFRLTSGREPTGPTEHSERLLDAATRHVHDSLRKRNDGSGTDGKLMPTCDSYAQPHRLWRCTRSSVNVPRRRDRRVQAFA